MQTPPVDDRGGRRSRFRRLNSLDHTRFPSNNRGGRGVQTMDDMTPTPPPRETGLMNSPRRSRRTSRAPPREPLRLRVTRWTRRGWLAARLVGGLYGLGNAASAAEEADEEAQVQAGRKAGLGPFRSSLTEHYLGIGDAPDDFRDAGAQALRARWRPPIRSTSRTRGSRSRSRRAA